ncbi:hypothetical protein [Rickettsia helvetica]|uniref:Uncharacterized protein n=1 Tax=Rickettsia helvetica TaxID=35789 RepID=A0ABP0T4C8_RICHE|nr:hypothetical protein [Rickettsia helvetica]MCZ6883809.1 hypothetical protein [Rickettsia endosymbiont of Ixodes ricinus]MCZ6896991.1 hypothetical protein [Rickettsia endosymbiont of Ixodes ricinus]
MVRFIYTEEPEEIQEILCLNREFVKKLLLFLINDFSTEDKNISLNIQNLIALKFYQIADKELLIDHLNEYEDVTSFLYYQLQQNWLQKIL